MSIESQPYYPEGFFAADRSLVMEKLGGIALDGPDKLNAVLDFDRTMTTNGPKDLTSWDVLSNLLPQEARAEDRRLYNMYQPLEFEHTLTLAQAEEWWYSTLRLYVDNGINVHAIQDAAKSIRLREGTVDLFNTLRQAGVPTTILSAGMKIVIRVVADRYGISPNLLLSTDVDVDRQGTIEGWEEESVIHILNKAEKGHPQLEEMRKHRPNTLKVGDALEDTAMAEGDERVIRVRVGDAHKLESDKVTGYLQESFNAGYDLVCLGDLRPVHKLAKWLIHGPEPQLANNPLL